MTNKELCKDFLPETPIKGRIGYYPSMTAEEYRALPLPMRCATWDADIEAVIFETFFSDYGTRARVAVHPEQAFKCLFRHSETDTQLYSVILEVFYSAFASKNGLYPPDSLVKPRDYADLTEEEIEIAARAGMMAAGMEKHHFRKQISDGT